MNETYKICTASTPELLMEMVEEYKEDGWTEQGGVAVTINSGIELWAQAMKPEESQ